MCVTLSLWFPKYGVWTQFVKTEMISNSIIYCNLSHRSELAVNATLFLAFGVKSSFEGILWILSWCLSTQKHNDCTLVQYHGFFWYLYGSYFVHLPHHNTHSGIFHFGLNAPQCCQVQGFEPTNIWLKAWSGAFWVLCVLINFSQI